MSALEVILSVGAMSLVAVFGQPPAQQTGPAPAAPAQQIRTNPEVQKVQPVGDEKRVQPDDIDKLLAAGDAVLLDVREPWEIEELGTREGSLNIPLAELPLRLAELPKDKAILTA